MSDIRSNLSTLTQTAADSPADQPKAKSARRLTLLLPLAILAGFAAIFLLLFRDRLIPATSVAVTPALVIEETVIRTTAPTPSKGGKLLFQASGWIEPDPLPIKATALTDGVVDQVKVLEGQVVKKGDLLATLIEDDTRLEVATATSEFEMTKADFEAHCIHTQIILQQMEGQKARLIADRASADEAADRLRRLEQAVTSAVEQERVAARFENSKRQAAIAVREAKIEELSHELSRIAFESVAVQAKVNAAETALAKANLAHDRTRIHAPSDGRVLRLTAAPGQKKMLIMEEEDSSTIAILYDPAHLQVRVDVPLADAAGLSVGQKAKVRCNLLPDHVFEGEVTRITGEADVQRNTLQAKVRIMDPDDKLRPEMLCRVEFLDTAPSAGTARTNESNTLSVYVPESAVVDNAVWICDPDTLRASRRTVMAAAEVKDRHRRIDEGIRPGEWVILNPTSLRENQRLSPQMERGL